MFNKTLKKVVSGALALTSAFACVTTLTACETSHPEVKMTISFDGDDYDLQYKLYRKVNPATTKHFLWLVEQNYYDGLCIHDYDMDNLRMYSGRYKAGENNDLEAREYFDFVKNNANLSSFPHSIWKDTEKAPLYTLRGEFSANGVEVTSGATKQSFGSLSMYYTQKDITNQYVYYTRNDNGELDRAEYKYNSATSMFFISLSETERVNGDYCTFATLTEDGKDELDDLMDAIEEYIEEHHGEEKADFVSEKSVSVDYDDPFVDETSVSYDIPEKAIVIKSIKITKY